MTPKFSGFTLLLLIIGTLASLGLTQDLKQQNKETLFLTEEAISSYKEFQETFHIRSLILGGYPKDSHSWPEVKEHLEKYCQRSCEVIGPDLLPKKLPPNFSLRLTGETHQGYLLVSHHEDEDGDNDESKAIKDQTATEFKEEVQALLQDNYFKDHSFTGVPYTNILLDQYSKTVKTVIFPALFAGVFLLLWFSFKGIFDALIIFFPGLMGAAISLLWTKLIFQTSNLITSVVPLLLFVIQMSLALHIFCTGAEKGSLLIGLKDKKEPTFLMVFTTFIGFGSLSFSSLNAISQFGWMTAVLLVLTTFLTILWLYAIALFKKEEREIPKPTLSKTEEKLLPLLSFFWGNKSILLVSLFSIIAGSVVLPKISIITDATEYFPPETGIKEKMLTISRDLTGTPLLEIILTPQGDRMSFLKKVDALEAKLLKEIQGGLISANSLVRLANFQYTKELNLPSNIFAYQAMQSQVPPIMASGYPTESTYRMTLLGEPQNVDRYEEKLVVVKELLKKENFKYQFEGLYFHLMEAQQEMIGTLFKSFFTSLVIICLVAFIYFKSFKLFLTFMLVNIVPVFFSFPLLWIFDLSFNIATVMTYSISLGLVVDSSFHTLHALKTETQNESFYQSVQKPIILASLLLAACFFLFSLSSFLPIKEFGICLGIVILLGMISDLKILPGLFLGRRRL